jgi:hypothetical protein
MASKHVEEILDILRSNAVAGCTNKGADIKIIGIDTYPEETNNIILLGNGKKITTDDLEFAEPVFGNSEIKILLGDYTFHLQRQDSK